MKTPMQVLLIMSILTWYVLIAPSTPASAFYLVKRIEGFSQQAKINNHGQIAGNSGYRVFLWDAVNGRRLLSPQTRGDVYVGDINDSGQVVGMFAGWSDDLFGYYHAFIWSPVTGMRDLGTLIDSDSAATSINNAGQVVGLNDERAFIWDESGGMKALNIHDYPYSDNAEINDRGQIVVSELHGNSYLWEEGRGVQNLGSWKESGFHSVDINNLGSVVGRASVFDSEALLWEETTGIKALSTLGDSETSPNSINDLGQVVGWSGGPSYNDSRAFLWEPGKGMVDLNTLIPGPIHLHEALDINNSGQIVARSGEKIYLLTPGTLDFGPFDTIDAGEIDIDHRPVRVNFSSPFRSPVVIARMTSKNGAQPCVLRVYNVDHSGFTLRIQEYEYLDGFHVQESVSYMVMEQAIHTLPSGALIEAGTFETRGTHGRLTPVPQKFEGEFESPPVIIASVNTRNGSQAVTGRVGNISASGFDYLLQEQEASLDNNFHLTETVAYIAWQPGRGNIGGIRYLVDRAPDKITHRQQIVSFEQPFSSTPIVLADMQTSKDSDTATLAVRASSETNLEMYVEEERSKDNERVHCGETAGYIALFED